MKIKFTSEQGTNLVKLRDYLESLPFDYKHFAMETFFQGSIAREEKYARENGGLPFCGTSACAIGHGPSAGILVPEYCISNYGVDWSKYSLQFIGGTGDDLKDQIYFDWMFGEEWEAVDNHHWGAAARIDFALYYNKLPKSFINGITKRRHTKWYRRYDKRYNRFDLTGQTFADDSPLITLREVAITADPKTLRKTGKFFKQVSKDLGEYDHYHYSSRVGRTDFVICNPDAVDAFQSQ